MTVVKIYGAETSRYEYFKYNLERFLDAYKLNIKIEEIKDISKIMEDNVLSIPTLRINSHVDIVYAEDEGIEKFVSKSKESILQEFAPEKLSKILVPTDFSENSLTAFKYALDLGRKVGAEIELLHVNHPSPLVVNGRVVVDDITIANQKYNLQNIVSKATDGIVNEGVDSKFVSIKDTYVTGLAADEIIMRSKEKDLVIMGTTGETAAKKILGSVSGKVSSKAHCPTLFVPDEKQFSGFKNIVYAYSPTSYDQKVITNIANIATVYKSVVHLVHVDDGSPFEVFDISSYVSHMYSDVNFICEEIRSENVASGITSYAEKINADLIILSKKKKSLLEKLVSRSETKHTLMKSHIPVMIYHSDDVGCLCGGACRRKPDSSCNH